MQAAEMLTGRGRAELRPEITEQPNVSRARPGSFNREAHLAIHNTTSRGSFMNPTSVLPLPALARVFELHISLSERFDAPAIERWRKRLHAYLSAHGLVAVISPEHIIVLPVSRSQPLGPYYKGLVLGWLVNQPEVVLVRVEQRHQISHADLDERSSQPVTVLEFRHARA
jgi:hypothetical protein